MSKKTILLIDGENILHQSFHKFEKLKSTDGKPSGAIFGFFKSLHMYITRFEPDGVYISFDNGHSPVRTKLLPNYKGHRKNISIDYESLQKQKAIIMKMLGMLRINYIFDKKKSTVYEGDDFLAYLAIKKFQSEKMILQYKDSGVLEIYAGVNTANRDLAAEKIIEELKRIKTEKITESEFLRGKEQVKSAFIMSRESTVSQMLLYGRNTLFLDKEFDFKERMAFIGNISYKDVLETIDEYFDYIKASAATVGSKRSALKL